MVAIDLLATTKDNLPSYGAWSGNSVKKAVHRPGEMRENNRAGNSYPAILRRERKQEGCVQANGKMSPHAVPGCASSVSMHFIDHAGRAKTIVLRTSTW